MLGAEQGGIDLRLSPVQRPVVCRHEFQVAAICLDLLQDALGFEVAVGATANAKLLVLACQHDLVATPGAAPARDDSVASDAFLGGRGRCEAVIEVATLGREFTELAYRHGIGRVAFVWRIPG
ncbi:MAG: hypothetical protein M3Y55_02615 [Pseudomonadota bacterium]|nr:hypothetical protein [Pseudomonadota bacterium]